MLGTMRICKRKSPLICSFARGQRASAHAEFADNLRRNDRLAARFRECALDAVEAERRVAPTVQEQFGWRVFDERFDTEILAKLLLKIECRRQQLRRRSLAISKSIDA